MRAPVVPLFSPDDSLSGTLSQSPPEHLLLCARDRKLSGTLVARDGHGRSVTLVFSRGFLTNARSSVAPVYLGQVLYEMGAISPDELNGSLRELSESKRLHGHILLERGLITQGLLSEALRDQAIRKARHLFLLPSDATIVFHPDADLLPGYGERDRVAVDVLPMVWRTVRESPNWEHVSAALACRMHQKFLITDESSLRLLDMDDDESLAIHRLRTSPTSLDELISELRIRGPRASVLLYLLLLARKVEGSEPSAGSDESGTPKDHGAHAEPRAFAAGGTPSGRFRKPFQSRTRSGSVIAPGVASKVRAPLGGLSPELAERRREIIERSITIVSEDYFTRLEVERRAVASQINASFAMLAELWHPNRLPVVLMDVRDEAVSVFRYLEEAHRTLVDSDKRRVYEGALDEHADRREEARARGRTPSTQPPSRVDPSAVDAYLERADLVRAESACDSILLDCPTSPDGQALHIWMTSFRVRPEATFELAPLIQRLDAVVAASPECGRAYYFRAQLHKRRGNHSAARGDFRRAALLGPYYDQSESELRLYERRERNGQLDSGSAPDSTQPVVKSLWSGLFGRGRR